MLNLIRGQKIKLNDLSSFSFDFEHEEFDIKDYIKKIKKSFC